MIDTYMYMYYKIGTMFFVEWEGLTEVIVRGAVCGVESEGVELV